MCRKGVLNRVGLKARWALLLGFLGCLTVVTEISSFAVGSVTLAWNASPDASVTGYRVYYGVASGVYTNSAPVGNNTTATLANLTDGVTYYFAATAYDAAGTESPFSNEASYSVPVVGQNQPPTLNTIPAISIGEDATPQTVTLAGIGTGSASETQTLTVTASSSNPALIPNPTVSYTSPNATGTLVFAPVANGFGTATITVTVDDGQSANNTITRSFVVTVVAVNDAPTLNAIGNLTVNEDAAAQTVNLSGIGSGAANESQVLTVTAVSSNPSLIPNPTVNYASPAATGSLVVTPVANANGVATITVTVNDGQAANNTVTQTFTVTVNPVNDAPTLAAIANVSISENAGAQTVPLAGITSGAANEANPLTVTATSSNPGLIPNPTVSYVSPSATGALNFAPVTDASGTATITVTVNDGQTANNTVTRTFTVTVNAVNNPPTLDPISNVTINEDAAVQTVILSGVGSGAANEAQTLTITATSSNPTLIPNPSVSYASPAVSGSLSFTPVANANGTATITVTVNDGQAANNLVTRSFTVSVNAVNDAPTLNAIANVSINENVGIQTVSLTGIGTGAANESQPLSVTAISSNPGLIPNPSVSYASPNATGSLSFTPVANANGVATITVTVNDGQAVNNTITRTFTVAVGAVNNQPTLGAISNVTINEDAGAQTVNLTGIGTGAANENDTLTVTATSSNPALIPNPAVSYVSPNATGSLTFTPLANANGTATITVTVDDGQTVNNTVVRTFTVTVTPGNDAPTLNGLGSLTINEDAGAQTVNLSGITSGAANETQTLTVTAISSNPGVIPNPAVSYTSPNTTGSLAFTPVANANGTATITVTVNDGQATNNTVSQSFVVTVNAINDAPTLAAIANRTIAENAGLQTVSLTGIGTGAANETQPLTITAVSSDPSLIPNPVVNYVSPGTTGSLAFTPVTNANGSATITVTVDDGQAANNLTTRSFVVTVTSVNSAPTITAIPNLSIISDTNSGPVNFTISDVETPASALRVTATSSAPGVIPVANIQFAGTGNNRTVRLTPVSGTAGIVSVTVTVSDGAATASSSFTVSVTAPAPAVGQLSMTKSGSGTVTPDLSTTTLIVGQSYTVTATPAAGYVFGGWSGSFSSTSSTLTFRMASNTVLQANFVASPYTVASGTYNGLFNEADEVRLQSSGAFNLYVDGNGYFSAWVQLGYSRYQFSGTFDLNLQSTTVVSRWDGTPLTVELQVGQGASAGQISGRVTDGVWSAPLSGGRPNASSTLAGDYTVVIPGTAGSATRPAGDGYATLHVGSDGLTTMNGMLADGQNFMQTAYVTTDGDWPLYVSLYVGKGSIVSWLSFTNLASSDVSGNLVWIKQAGASATCYPLGFTNGTKAVGSIYAPASDMGKELNLSGAVVSFSGGDLTSAFNNVVSVNNGGQVVNLSANSMTFKIAKNTGLFSGDVQDPASGKNYSFGGVVLQKQNAAYGTMTGPTRGSRVVLAAP